MKKPGYVLLSVLVIMSIMIVMTYYLADILYSEYAIARNQRSATVALNLAEAGTQEAIWRIQNDTATRDTFLNTVDGMTTIPTKSLINGGTYSVIIQNTAKANATVTATGYNAIGLKQAQRKITLNVIQTATTVAYPYDAALFVGGQDSGNVYLHNLNLQGGGDSWSIYSGGNIDIGNASLNVPNNIFANGDIIIKNANVLQGGTQQENYPTVYTYPGFDINSNDPSSYKSQAIAQGQYYTSAQFANLLKTQTTFNGIVYVAGSAGVSIKNTSVTFNGAIVSEGSISCSNANLTINHTTGPSGLITLSNFTVTNANVNITGLVYVGISASAATNANITISGAMIAHDFSANNINLTLNFNRALVEEVIASGGGGNTPVIQFQHWEEEY